LLVGKDTAVRPKIVARLCAIFPDGLYPEITEGRIIED
jgi:hypothetical protein